MKRRDLLEKILEGLKDSRVLGNALLVLLKNDELDDKTIDNLIVFMEESLNKVEDLESKKKIMKGIEAMKKMKEIEREEKLKDDCRLADLDSLIENI